MSALRSTQQSASENRSSKTHGDDLKRALNWILNGDIFDNLRLHGNVNWSPINLVRLAIFWVWSSQSTMVNAAHEGIELVIRIFGESAVKSYQGLTSALTTYSGELVPRLWNRMHYLMEQCGGSDFRIGIWLALAMDGSRISMPRTKQNELRFCKQGKSKRKQSRKNRRSRQASRKRSEVRTKSHYDPQPVGPQMWLTMIWHIGLNLPWCWKIGPSYASERDHVSKIVAEQELPTNTLLCGDAGFYGYDFWSGLQSKQHHFLARVGANVRLLKHLGYVRERNGIVYSWPDSASRKNQPPLVLRLLHFKCDRGDIYLVTNVLDENLLTDAQAGEIYLRRWGIELQFRAFKQTFDRSKLRSRTPDCAEVELHWSLLGLSVIQLLALKERTRFGDPDEKTSVAAAIRIIRMMMNKDSVIRPAKASLSKQLAEATTDTYERTSSKKSRNYPRRKDEPSAGKPKILSASKKQKLQLREIHDSQSAA